MEHESIKVIRKIGPGLIEFAIVAGREAEAAEYLINLLKENNTLSLNNDKDEGGEGLTSFRVKNGVYYSRNGGHGWQGKWDSRSQQETKEIIIELAPHNKGGYWRNIARFKGKL